MRNEPQGQMSGLLRYPSLLDESSDCYEASLQNTVGNYPGCDAWPHEKLLRAIG